MSSEVGKNLGQGLGAPGGEATASASEPAPPPGPPEDAPIERRRRPRPQDLGLDDDEAFEAWEASFVFAGTVAEGARAGDESPASTSEREPTRADPPGPDSDLVLDLTDELGQAATPLSASVPDVDDVDLLDSLDMSVSLDRDEPTGAVRERGAIDVAAPLAAREAGPGAGGFDRDLRLDPDVVELSPASFGFRPSPGFELDAQAAARAVAAAPAQAASSDEAFRAQLHALAGELALVVQGPATDETPDPAAAERHARLATAAARAAERLQGADALRFYQDALAALPGHTPALRGVMRLSLQAGLWDEALAAAAALGAALPADAAAYAAVVAEARAHRSTGADAGADDLAASLRACEAGLREAGGGAGAALGLINLGERLGGEAGAALRTYGAMLRELAGAGAPTDDLPPQAAVPPITQALARLRAATRAGAATPADAAAAQRLVEQTIEGLPSSPLTPALLRWAAALAQKAGDAVAAQRLLARARASGAPLLPAREGIDLASDDLAGDERTRAAAGELGDRLASVPVETVAPVAARLARGLREAGRAGEALALLRQALERDPASGPALAPALESLVTAADAAAAREAAALVAAADPSRRADVALSATITRLVDAPHSGASDGATEGAADSTNRAPELRAQALGQLAQLAQATAPAQTSATAERLDPALAWWLVWQLRAAARGPESVELLGRVAAAFADTLPEVAGALAQRAGVLAAAANPQAYLATLPVPRLHEPAADDPGALARALVANRPDARVLAARFETAAAVGGPARLHEAVGWLIQAGAFGDAFAALDRGGPAARGAGSGLLLLRRLLRMSTDPMLAAERLREQAASATDLRQRALYEQLAAEALERAGKRGEAAAIYRELLAGPLARDADLGLRRTLLALRDAGGLIDFWRDEFDASSGAGKNRAAAHASVEKARVLLDLQEDRSAAAAEIGTALALDPESVPARVLALCQPGVLVGAEARIAELERLGRDMPSQRAVALFFAALLADGEGEAKTARRLYKAAAGGIFGPAPVALLRRHLLSEEEGGLRGAELAELLSAAAAAVPQTTAADPRLGLSLYLRAADAAAATGELARAETLVQRALALSPQDLPTLARLARLQESRGDHAGLLATREAEARALREPGRRAAALFEAAVIAADHLQDQPRAAVLLARVLELDPRHEGAFARHKQMVEASGDSAGLAALLARRVQGLPPEETLGLRLERAVLLAGPLGDRAQAKRELRDLLALDAHNPVALATLADLELADGEAASAAELSLRQAALDDDRPRLVACFLRMGRIYQGPLADIKQAVSAYEGVLDLDADNREALLGLSELYAKAGEASRGVAVTERLLEVEADPAERRALLVRLAKLWEQAGDVRRAGIAFRHAAGEAPRDLAVIGELVRFHERHKDTMARNLLLDGAIALARDDVRAGRDPASALRALIPLLRWRERPAAALAAAQLLARLGNEPAERAELTSLLTATARPGAGRPGSLARFAGAGGTGQGTGQTQAHLDEAALPRELPPGLAHVMRVVGPALARASKPDLRRFQVGRAERHGRATDLRMAFDGLAGDLQVRDFEVYVSPGIPNALAVEPGDPPAFVLGPAIVALGPLAVRFAAGFLLRLVSSHFALLLREGPIEAVALVAGLVRQFRPEHRPPYLPEAVLKAADQRLGRAMSRAMRTELAPLAVQLAAGVSPEELFTATQELAARAGLLACGDIGPALDVLAAYAGRAGTPLPGLLQVPLIAQLVDFALSDEYDTLVAALGPTPRG